jgi:hypothetical protein
VEGSHRYIILGTISTFSWRDERKPRRICHESRPPDQDLNSRSLECEAEALPNRPATFGGVSASLSSEYKFQLLKSLKYVTVYFLQQKEWKKERINQRQWFTYRVDAGVLLQSYSHFLVPDYFISNFVKYSPHWEISQANVLDFNESYGIFYRTHFLCDKPFLRISIKFDISVM